MATRFDTIHSGREYQTSHPDIGMTEDFKHLAEAIQYCNNG
jgi:hypothetical protein